MSTRATVGSSTVQRLPASRFAKCPDCLCHSVGGATVVSPYGCLTAGRVAVKTLLVPTAQTPPRTGYAPVNGLQMYYEIHGSGGTPLLLLHGGLFNIDLQFGALIPALAATRQVIAADFQAHGRTNDVDRPLRSEHLASDVVGLLQHLEVPQADVFGFSVGGATALHLAVNHPELVRKLIVSSASFHPEGDREENSDEVSSLTVDMISGTPMEQDYRAKSPHPDKLQDLLDKLGTFDQGFKGWADADIEGIAAPTLITLGDCDAVTLD